MGALILNCNGNIGRVLKTTVTKTAPRELLCRYKNICVGISLTFAVKHWLYDETAGILDSVPNFSTNFFPSDYTRITCP